MKNIILISTIILLMLTSSDLIAAGDAAAGKGSYAMCAACHGGKGEGNQAMKAPKLAGQLEWYIISSLQKFKNGTRGTKDPVAGTMIPMAAMLSDKQMNDVAAYIGTL